MDTISGFSGKSYKEIVQKKDPGNHGNGVHGARVFTGIFSDTHSSIRLLSAENSRSKFTHALLKDASH
jgi:hypothetical protein